MGQLLFGTMRLIEATLVYLLAFAIARHLKTPIPPIGSTAYVIFLVLWPIVIRPILGPGLRTIPIVGDILDLLDLIARSGFPAPRLMKFASDGQIEKAKTLIGKGHHVDLRDDVGRTPLMFAAKDSGLEMVQFLIDAGADVNAKDKGRLTALMAGCGGGNSDVVKKLLENGAEVNAADKDGITALMAAAEFGHTEIVRILLDNKVDTSKKNADGHTAIAIARRKSHQDIVRLIDERCASNDNSTTEDSGDQSLA